MPLTKYPIVIVLKDTIRTDLMQRADVFEKFKVLYEAITVDVEGSRPTATAIKKIRQQFDIDTRQWELIAIFRPDDTDGAWRNDEVKVVSNGTSFVMFDEWLKSHGFLAA